MLNANIRETVVLKLEISVCVETGRAGEGASTTHSLTVDG